MGKITEEIIALITRQVQDHGIVVWYDPERAYGDVVDRLGLPGTTVLCYQGSFFELRHRMEPFLEFVDDEGQLGANVEAPPRLLVYVPLDRARTQHALIEAEAAGAVMEPGGSPWQRNTRLKVLAERVFKRIAPDRVGSIAAEVEAGRRTLAELDWLADQTGELGAVKLIFGTTAIADVVLAFLSSEEHDPAILSKHALPELASLCETELGLRVSPDQPLGQLRHQLCRSLLLAELALKVNAAGGDTSKLAAIPVPEADRQREQLLAVCQQWRNRLDRRESYAAWADKVQTEAQVVALGLSAPALTDTETFSHVESLLLDWVEAQILEGAIAGALEVATWRKSSFWSLYEGEYRLRWTLIEIAAQLLLVASRIASELKTIRKDPKVLLDAYTQGMAGKGGEEALPWSVLDRHHRHLEYRYAMLERPEGPHAQLEKVMAQARRRYAEVVGQCAEWLAEALAAAGFEVKGVLSQEEVFPRQVHGRATEGKTAYVLVDALRYEMGQELVEGLGDELEVHLGAAIAQLPSITEVGMAALMPGADRGMELVDAGAGRVGIRMGEAPGSKLAPGSGPGQALDLIQGPGQALLKDRASRMKQFESKVAGRPLVLKLNDLMKPTKKRQQEIIEADLLLVTSQEIDRRGEETEDEEEARRFMDEVLEKLRRGIRRLAALGFRHIIVAADHGYLFVEELNEALRIDPPGGQTVDLHPRVWVGRGGVAAPGTLRVKASELGLAGDLELAFPRGLACFRTRGGRRGYFHGGISLQELVIPVATIVVRQVRASDGGTSTILLTLAKPKITTRFFSVEVRYVVGGLFDDAARRVRVEVRAGRTEVGVAAMAAYGFEEGTQEIVLEKDRPNAITLMLTGDVDAPTVSVHVLDATTQVELTALKNIPVEITI